MPNGQIVSTFEPGSSIASADLIPVMVSTGTNYLNRAVRGDHFNAASAGTATAATTAYYALDNANDIGRNHFLNYTFTAPIAVVILRCGVTYRWIRGTQEVSYADWFTNPDTGTPPGYRITHPGTVGEAFDFIAPDLGWRNGTTPLEFYNVHGGPPPWNDPADHQVFALGISSWGTATAVTGLADSTNKYIELNGVRLYFGSDNPPTFPAPAGSFYFSTAGNLYVIANTETGIWSLNAGFV